MCIGHSARDLDVICNKYTIIYFCPIYIIWTKSDKLVELYRPLLDGVEIKLCKYPHFARQEILLGIPCLNLEHEQRAAGLQTFNNLKFGLKNPSRSHGLCCISLLKVKHILY